MLDKHSTTSERPLLQQPFEAAVVIQTTLRPTLAQAVRSVFAQQGVGRIQILIGVDVRQGDPGLPAALRGECPGHVALTVLDPGYSTSQRHGSFYPNFYGGALRTVLSYLANSRFVAYLDDDNWYAPDHLSTLLQAIQGKAWAFSLRTLIDKKRDEIICEDRWESLGPGRGVYAETFGGFVDTNCLMLDKIACHGVLPAWCLARFPNGVGEDRVVFDHLKTKPFGASGRFSVFYRTALTAQSPHLLWEYKKAGIDLGRFEPPENLPPQSFWDECASRDRAAAAPA
jgi:hypothetical protein